ncbi:bifunctional diguanylate cyclase/phosphodiesterase [Croceicoccus sp. Ery5]|uniref:putative bifunctional diguanylate cyclase/phosphodiesterase n=1 Tax=Croceicoccus sp. Ery5 TaxID=1703340 RepID=UPI001E6283FE|nr:EAL domain-containing protein [Croceicoccus sp. Ery5]
MGARQEAVLNRDELLLARRLGDYAAHAPVAAMLSGLSAMIACAIAPRELMAIWHALCGIWLLAIGAVSTLRVWHAGRIEPDTIDFGYIRRQARKAEVLAYADAALWALGLSFIASMLDPSTRVTVNILITGMLATAAIRLRSMPRIGIALTVAFVAGGVGSTLLRGDPVDFVNVPVMLFYATVVLYCFRADAAAYEARFNAEFAVSESAETIRLLLHDYEAQSADWLWRVDHSGCLVGVCDRFGEAASMPRPELEGKELVSLFRHGPAREHLSHRLLRREPFRDLTLELVTRDDDPLGGRWWMLSASPREDGTIRGVARDVTATRRTEQRVAYMAHHDGLTGLANRFLFGETLAGQLARQRKGDSCALLYLDLDHFKTINDTLGHSCGDLLLTEAARRITSKVKGHDLVARLGGDEFAVLLTRFRDAEEALAVADRIVAAITEPFRIEGQKLHISTSVGVAFHKGQGGNSDDLLRQADLALYAAKARGRACFAQFEPWMEDRERERAALEADLRDAIKQGQFALHFQPLVNIDTGEVAGFEALVRWEHPTMGVVMPGEFIPIAEDTGLIVPLGEWIMRNAIAQAARWAGGQRVAINLSPIQMRSPRLMSQLVTAIAHTGIDPARIELEITENVLMQESEANVALLHKLRELGVRISLDDFGTGYSSLNYLRSFPFDKIKIDKCFVADLEKREDCQAIIRAVTSLAGTLGMDTVAEGVEREEQLEWLRAAGCTEVQGYYISYPFNVEELSDGRPFDSECERWRASIRRLPSAA